MACSAPASGQVMTKAPHALKAEPPPGVVTMEGLRKALYPGGRGQEADLHYPSPSRDSRILRPEGWLWKINYKT